MSFSKEVKLELKKKENNENPEAILLKEVFIAKGSINDPNRTYNLQMVLKNELQAEKIKEILNKVNIQSKFLKTERGYCIYIKDGEEISKFLAFVGASASLLKYEEIRVIKDMRNNVNRIVNCETANLNKTIDAAINQIEDIKYIKKKRKFDTLPKNLQEIAEIRLNNPDLSLIELGELLEIPIGKSGVSHRLNKITGIANSLRDEK